MTEKQRYKFWTRDQLFGLMKSQAEKHDFNVNILRLAVYDESWDPVHEFNGCNFVQDDFHPFIPCFIHDWRWICFDYNIKWDWEFHDNLRKFGYSKFKAELFYIAVRCGWLFYYKWKKKYGKDN